MDRSGDAAVNAWISPLSKRGPLAYGDRNPRGIKDLRGEFMTLSARWLRWTLPFAFAAFAGSAGGSGESTPDYEFIPVPKGRANAAKPVPKYQFLYGPQGRWPGPMRWHYNHSNAPPPFDSDPAGTLAQVRAALESWTNVCGITYVYEGETSIPPNTRINHPQFGEQPDDINVVGWDTLDGNTAGVAWVWYDPDTRELTDGDIILSIQRVQSQVSMQRTATHEWGHAIGLAHSNVEGTLMSGPPDSEYNSLTRVQKDDVRGCRCLYGAAAGNPAGYSCSLPARIDFGLVPINGASAPRTMTLTNHGNAPLSLTNVALNSLRVTRDDGCPAGTVLQPGQSCSVTIVARPTHLISFIDVMTFNTSDGPYAIPVSYTGSNDPVPTPQVTQLVEFFHAGFGHYFVTHLQDEITKLDNGTFSGWSRTGRSISAWTTATAGSSPVCRFFSEKFAPKSSHFYTSFTSECQTVKSDPSWSFEGEVFHVGLPDAQGNCAVGTQRVYRLYNNGQSGAPNHRFTTDLTLRAQLMAQGWVPEGAGEGVTMCAPM
jgi:hypothetical protein